MAEPTGFAAPILAYPQIMKNLHALVSGSSAIHGLWIEHKVGALSSPSEENTCHWLRTLLALGSLHPPHDTYVS